MVMDGDASARGDGAGGDRLDRVTGNGAADGTGHNEGGDPHDHGGGTPVRHVWSASDRFVPRRFVQPIQRLMALESAGGIALLVAAVAAVLWANGPGRGSYEQFWQTPLTIELGGLVHLDQLDLRAWVTDGLMAVFFFVVGLEIKRELVHGELRDRRAAALPVLAAVGGMIVPAAVYVLANAGGAGGAGWGIPMATDIAFALGVLALLGDRVPSGAKIFLLTLAVADDLGAIVVIAIFYTDDLSLGWLAAAIAGLVAVRVLARADVRSLTPYVALAGWAWLALHESGVHATLAGVALGLLTPAWSFYDPRRFAPEARRLVERVDAAFADDRLTDDELEACEGALGDLSLLTRETRSPLERLESRMVAWSAFAIVPVFALANAGVPLSLGALSDAVGDPITTGVAVGLLVGKPVGIVIATWLAIRLGLGVLPAGTTWRHVTGLGVTAGIGFTVALFVTGLSFDDPVQADAAKMGVFAASIAAGILGLAILRSAPRPAGTGSNGVRANGDSGGVVMAARDRHDAAAGTAASNGTGRGGARAAGAVVT
jgi:NhaA family Na+:H+ antiporter